MKERELFKQALDSRFHKDHIKTRILSCVEGEIKNRHYPKTIRKRRALTAFCIIFIALFSIGSLSAYAHYAGWIKLSFMRRAPATSWPEDAVHARDVNLLLDQWNEWREEKGYELFDTLLLTQMYMHGDITLREILHLFGKEFPPDRETQKIFQEYTGLNQLIEKKESEKEKFVRLMTDKDNGIRLTAQEMDFLSEFEDLMIKINIMRFSRSEKLMALILEYGEETVIYTPVPQELLKRRDDRSDGDISSGTIEYTAVFHAIDREYTEKNPIVLPAYRFMMEAFHIARDRYREELYGKHSSLTEEEIQEAVDNTVVTKDDLETAIRRFYDVKVTVMHQSVSNEDERLNISYDPQTKTYAFTPWVSNPEMTFAYVFDEKTDGNRITCTISFLHFKGIGLYDGTYYDDLRNPVLVHEVSNIWPELYAVKAIEHLLPKWEFVFEKYKNEYEELRIRIVSAVKVE